MNERSDRPVLVVGIAGGIGSGKSTLARTLVNTLGPAQATRLPHDAYYRDGFPVPAGARDGDIPDTIDQALFLEQLALLRAGRPIRPPHSSVLTEHRMGEAAVVTPRPIVIVEGLLLLWDPAVRAALDLTIYLDAPERVRLERRLARNSAERGRTTDDALTQFAVAIRHAHRTYVEPTRAMADLVLSTGGRLEPIAEIAVAVVLDRLARRRGEPARRAS